jgi:hypothetical protein
MARQKEIIEFLFEVDSEWTNLPPTIEIYNNNQQIVAPCEILTAQTFECIIELDYDKKINLLEIKRNNHDGCTPQLLQLISLKADGNDLAPILNHTKFYPNYPQPWYHEQLSQGNTCPEFHLGWLSWGWNGTWQMSYSTPFYEWLLKEL